MHDLTFHKGFQGKPAVIFIHGLGMDKRIWINPDDARILGGSFPLRYLLSKKPEAIVFDPKRAVTYKSFFSGEVAEGLKTSFHDLKALGYTVVTWSQKRPAGPIEIVVEELKEIIASVNGYSKRGIVLIGHSRGGLIARKYLEEEKGSIKGLITIATPHCGSSMARWAEYISPLASFIKPLIQERDRKKFAYTIKRILDFIGSKAIKELLPESEFFNSLKDNPCKNIYCLSFGGISPSLFSLYRWRQKDRGKNRILEPDILLSIPDILEKIIPKRFYPQELRRGYGDGLVSSKSSQLPQCNNHYNFSVNHAAILFEERVREKIIKALDLISAFK